MTRSDQTIHNMFDALQNNFGAFHEAAGGTFEDVPASVLRSEFADEAQFDDLPASVQEAMAHSTALRAA
ncbi:MAG: hypothetical protein ACTSQV_00555 [Alphaproteobacteria bacterium]